jgi:hypothetical protein
MLISLSHIGSSARYWGEEVTLTPLGGRPACKSVSRADSSALAPHIA